MTTDKLTIDIHESKTMPFSKRLQSAREAMQLERKDVAAQLRLNERIIFMMEKNRYAADIPVTFIRGYLRSYAKFLNIPEYEIKKAVEHIKPKPVSQQAPPPNTKPITLDNKGSYYFMHIFTFLIVVTLISLIGTWWYTQNPATTSLIASNQLLNKPATLPTPVNAIADSINANTDTNKSTDIAKQSESSESTPAIIKMVATKSAKANIQSDDYEDDEDVE